jgi:2-keto-3-deoxy-6-phosphogluconate aldolase
MAMVKDVVVATGLTATGSNLAGALVLNAAVNVVSTAAASTGVSLPANATPGTMIYVLNQGANALAVYPATATGTINAGSAGAAISLATTNYTTRSRLFVCTGADLWVQVGTA